MKFRKKPVEIEAVQWEGRLGDILWFLTDEFSVDDNDQSLYIPTLEGEMRANVGDWIIRGVAGEFYPCRADIFEQTYEAVEVSAS